MTDPAKRTFQFFHWTPNKKLGKNNGTYLVEVPSYEEFVSSLLDKTTLEIQLTHARLNPIDQFVKKIGREVATKKMAEGSNTHVFTPCLWNLQTDILILQSVDGKFGIAVQLRGPGKKPFLLQVEE